MELVNYKKDWLQRLRQTPKISEYVEAPKDLAKAILFASDYYGIAQPSDEVLKVLALDIINSYPTLRQGEFIEAFKLASKGVLEVSLELYGKPMNAWLIHQIIGSYLKFRAKQVKKLQEKDETPRVVGQCPPETSAYFDSLIKKYKVK